MGTLAQLPPHAPGTPVHNAHLIRRALGGPALPPGRLYAATLALAALVAIAAACVERQVDAPAPADATQAGFEFPATLTATPTVTPAVALTEPEVAALLRRAVCWYDDPSRAASCLPPGQDAVEAIEAMGASRDPRFVAPLIDMRWLDVGWRRWVDGALEALTGERFDEPRRWYEWAAGEEPSLPPGYASWKGRLLSFIDPRFAALLNDETEFHIRPNQIVWAGTGVGEVPALDPPETVHRLEERYLDPSDIVYGLLLNSRARAYPRRIVAWHETVVDEDGDLPAVVVYCGPCGGAVAYDPRAGGESYRFQSSGLVYDSRRLLVDEQTGSLWDAFTGRPVAGPLAGSGLALDRWPLVTTTWGDWRSRHPNTSVLALDTGYVRDYSEGAAIAAEPAVEGPSFPLAGPLDERLPVKQAVVGVQTAGVARAYPAEALRARGIVHDTVGGVAIVLLSEGPGAAVRVYASGALEVSAMAPGGDDLLLTGDDGSDGTRWFVQERALVSTLDGREYRAVPAQEAYWYAWSRAHPETTVWGE